MVKYDMGGVNPLGKFIKENMGDYSLEYVKRVVQQNNGKGVLLSDIHFLGDIEKRPGVPLVLASDGLYFMGRISDVEEEDYTFTARFNGEESEHRLSTRDLAGLLRLDGEVSEDFPIRFRRLPGDSFGKSIISAYDGKTVLFSYDYPDTEEQNYLIGENIKAGEQRFSTQIRVVEGQEKVRKPLEFVYNGLAGFFVPTEANPFNNSHIILDH